MRVLIVTYCFGTAGGQVLIGVYKRGLRVGLELCDRGHDVFFFCSGRENFHDEMTATAEQRMTFVEWPVEEDTPNDAAASRRLALERLGDIRPDVIVIGEAPLAGALLAFTLYAAELGIPAVCLDNVYGPELANLFCDIHGPIFDGIVLTGPSSFYTAEPPPFLLQVPPYIEPSAEAARQLLRAELGLRADRVITVLAYDRNVEALGASIFAQLAAEDAELEAVFISHRIEECQQRLDTLPANARQRASVVKPLPDPLHFGVLQQSRLTVGKCAFMQVTECLSLHTPIIGFYFEGDFSLRYIPDVCRRFAFASSQAEADQETLDVARRFLSMAPAEMASVHDGALEATKSAAAFIERVPSMPARDTIREAAASLDLEPESLARALATRHRESEISVESYRVSRIRNSPKQRVHAVVCRYLLAGAPRIERLWWHLFDAAETTLAEAAKARSDDSGRRLYSLDPEGAWMIEQDVGQARLPALEDV